MIKPLQFKQTCKDILGEKNCEFSEYRSEYSLKPGEFPADYYIQCRIDGQKVAVLHVGQNMNTNATVWVRNGVLESEQEYYYVNYVFTLKMALTKLKKRLKSERAKLFEAYVKVTDIVGDGRKNIKTMIQYLTNVEFINEYDIVQLFSDLFDSVCKGNPAVKDELTLDLFELFLSKVKINKITEITSGSNKWNF